MQCDLTCKLSIASVEVSVSVKLACLSYEKRAQNLGYLLALPA